jgi:hypothetical protein
MKKSIYSLPALVEIMRASNRRYLAFLSDLADPTAGVKKVEQLSVPAQVGERMYRGFNLFAAKDLNLFTALLRGEVALGVLRNVWLRNVWLRKHLPDCTGPPDHRTTGPPVSRMLKRLHVHGLIKKVGRTYRYHLTERGREIAATALKLRERVVIPSLAHLLPA